MKKSLIPNINFHEIFFDITVIFIQSFFLLKKIFFIQNFSSTQLIILTLLISILFTYYITNIAKNILNYSIFQKNRFLKKFIIITYFIIGITISSGIPLFLKNFGYINFYNNNIEAIFFVSNILLTLVGFIMGYDLSGGFIFLGLFFFIYLWFGGIYFIMDYCVDKYSNFIPAWLLKTIGFIFIFLFPVITALLIKGITDKFNIGVKLNVIKTFIKSNIFKNLSSILFAIIFCFWAELYYEITLKEITSNIGKFLYLVFSGVVPLRIILLLEPPIKKINVIVGVISIFLFIYNHM